MSAPGELDGDKGVAVARGRDAYAGRAQPAGGALRRVAGAARILARSEWQGQWLAEPGAATGGGGSRRLRRGRLLARAGRASPKRRRGLERRRRGGGTRGADR